MRRVLWLLIFVLLTSSIWATSESEPNNTMAESGVLWSQNGQHSGTFNYPNDIDYWSFYGFPGDTITVSTVGQTNLDTVLRIFNNSGVEVAFNDDYNGTSQSMLTFVVPDDAMYYLSISEYYGYTGGYMFTIGGEFISLNANPLLPQYFNIPNGATGVDPNTPALTWVWGDGCFSAIWFFYFGTNPDNLVMLNTAPGNIFTREDGYNLPIPIAGGFTYYYKITLMLGGVQYMTPTYNFTTAQITMPIPFSENFDAATCLFTSLNSTNPWILVPVETGNPQAIATVKSPNTTSPLMENVIHNLAANSPAYLSFRQLSLMEPEQDHSYIEYSTDGGTTWAIFTASVYHGSGIYDNPTGNSPEGPCFDAGSYANWADYTNTSSMLGNWHTETFDLTPWAGSTDFRVRFRAVYDNNEIGVGWIIDDFSIQVYPPTIPSTPNPVTASTNSNTNLRLTWNASNATGYDIAFGTNPAALATYTITTAYWDALNLTPYTTYYWKVRSHNSLGYSDWSPLWTFTTQQYVTPWHQNSNLRISQVVFGSINNTSVWNGYTNYSTLTTSAQCGVDLPISVLLAGSYGPEAVRVWVDVNRDAVFSNNPADGEYWDIFWGSGGFQGNIHLPSHLTASATRMRVQAIHTNGSDVLAPAGVFQYGETEDYLLLTADSPILAVSPTSASFPETVVGFSSDPVRFTFDNIGGQNLDITLTGITGTGAGAFTLTEGNTYPIHLTTNVATVDIRFAPQSAGTFTAALLVRDNLSRTDHNYTLTGTAIGTQLNGALTFDGSGEYVNIGSAAPLQSLTKVTLETWFKWDGSTGIQFMTSKNIEELEIHTNGALANLRFIPTNGVYIDSHGGRLIAGQWQHIACVYDPSASIGKIYIDGIDATWQNNGPNPLTTPMQSNTSSFRLGIRQGGTYPLAGSMDEVRIWNIARSADDIRSNIHLLQAPATPGLVAEWRLDEMSGNNIYDQINGLNGYLINMEAGDRTQSTMPLGWGAGFTLTPSVTGTPYNFTGTGTQMTFSRIDAAGPVTITRLNNTTVYENGLNNHTWLIRCYDNITRTADMTYAVTEDVQSSNLPAYNYSLLGRTPDTSGIWSRIKRAASANVEANTITFTGVDCSIKQTRIEWSVVTAPNSPQNVTINCNGSNIQIQWTAVPGAARYKVYSSTAPNGTFIVNTSGTFSGASWTAPVTTQSMYYRIVSEID